MEFWGDKCLTKVDHAYKDRYPEHPSSCQDDPLSYQILLIDALNTKHTNDKTSHPNSIEELDI